jgi:hypothetical protein
MTASRDPERLIHAFLQEGAENLQDRVYDAVRAEIDRKRQRVAIGPWRTPIMNRITAAGLGVAAVVVALVVGIQLLGPPAPGGTGGAPSAEPSATPTPSPSVASPSPSASRTAPPLTESFTSTLHGISMSYPEGWTTQAATEPWTGDGYVFGQPPADFLYDPTLTDHLFLTVASQPIGDSTPDEWVAEKRTVMECAATEPVVVDGASGQIGTDECNVVAVTIDGRGYFIALYTSGDEPWISPTYDRAWFEGVLATVQLQPEDAVDVTPSASP